MDNSYTYKKIIFGLRKEYMEIEKQLIGLKKYVDVSRKVDTFNFYITGDPCKLFLYLRKKKNLLEKIENLLGTYLHGTTNYKITDGIKKQYYYKNRVICSIKNQEELNRQINQIVQADFFKNIVANNYNYIPCIENQINTLQITPGHISLINDDYPCLDYYPHKDKLIMRNEQKIITPDDIYKLLNLSLDGKYLNDYHRRVLDNYEEKEIYIEDSFNSSKAKIEIIEEPKKLILKPKKNI